MQAWTPKLGLAGPRVWSGPPPPPPHHHRAPSDTSTHLESLFAPGRLVGLHIWKIPAPLRGNGAPRGPRGRKGLAGVGARGRGPHYVSGRICADVVTPCRPQLVWPRPRGPGELRNEAPSARPAPSLPPSCSGGRGAPGRGRPSGGGGHSPLPLFLRNLVGRRWPPSFGLPGPPRRLPQWLWFLGTVAEPLVLLRVRDS